MDENHNIMATDSEIQKLLDVLQSRLGENKRIRRNLPQGGRIHIDRALPFLVVYRCPLRRRDLGTERLVTSEASYLVAKGGKRQTAQLRRLVKGVSRILTERFGVCLILEIWAGAMPVSEEPLSLHSLTPSFSLISAVERHSPWFLSQFEQALKSIKVAKSSAKVELKVAKRCAPPGWQPLLDDEILANNGARLYGLEVAPIYRDPETGEVFPSVLREQRHALSRALRVVFFDFVRKYTRHPAAHRHALGRRAMVKAVWEADRILAEVASSFDFLLQITPVNAEQAWNSFKKGRFDKKPKFHYRPIPFEPIVLKRSLYKAPVERIEDPALSYLFRQKVTELDRQITLLQDRNTPSFVHESAQLYGEVSESLVQDAKLLLWQIPPRTREASPKDEITAEDFVKLAEEEIQYYRSRYPALNVRVELRDDVTGLLVSRGSLLVSRYMTFPASRVDALLQHEIGTHVLTYHNGRVQPLRQLYTGLAGYDALQEGLAVLSEYLVDGLSRPRLRLLAGRVLAARNMLDGSDFIENFRYLTSEYGFNERTAYTISMRTHRGGGLTKDAVYLQGLRRILKYIADGGSLDLLFVGKIAGEHLPIIRELLWRGILKEPPLRPRYMEREDVRIRLAELQKEASVLDLVKRRKR